MRMGTVSSSERTQHSRGGGILQLESMTAQNIRRCDTIPEVSCLVTLRPRNVRRCATIPESPIHTPTHARAHTHAHAHMPTSLSITHEPGERRRFHFSTSGLKIAFRHQRRPRLTSCKRVVKNYVFALGGHSPKKIESADAEGRCCCSTPCPPADLFRSVRCVASSDNAPTRSL